MSLIKPWSLAFTTSAMSDATVIRLDAVSTSMLLSHLRTTENFFTREPVGFGTSV
jgi:hypothetical protein